ncbi:hypothetical protein BD311DRAFT_742103 [Dichomitus squalens]|uniref:Uncharacterized protein n=1 Tax=Dichomitus squalens TaxID=114155 RepID=A0A4Q9M9X3_9APHY|nr:hypothetical protein BD311DRAFT_742103 [Dichomitus squalens]
MAPAVTLDDTLGAAFIGNILAACLYGMTTLQTYIYYGRSDTESKTLKSLIAFLCGNAMRGKIGNAQNGKLGIATPKLAIANRLKLHGHDKCGTTNFSTASTRSRTLQNLTRHHYHHRSLGTAITDQLWAGCKAFWAQNKQSARVFQSKPHASKSPFYREHTEELYVFHWHAFYGSC